MFDITSPWRWSWPSKQTIKKASKFPNYWLCVNGMERRRGSMISLNKGPVISRAFSRYNAILLSRRATHLVCSAFLVAAQCCVLAHSRWEMILRRLLLDIFNHNWTLFNFIVYWGITWVFISIKPALGRSLNLLAYSEGRRIQAFYDIFMTAVVVYATGLWHIASLLHIFALITAACG